MKPGDKVLCIDASDDDVRLVEGQIYTVKERDRLYVVLEETPGGWDVERFELVQPQPQSFFIVTPCDDPYNVLSVTSHPSEAESFARSRASQDPDGRTFVISRVTYLKGFNTEIREHDYTS